MSKKIRMILQIFPPLSFQRLEIFTLNLNHIHDNNVPTVDCIVANKEVKFVIDSGSPVCTITKRVWKNLDKKQLTNITYDVHEKFYAYSQNEPLNVIAKFKSNIKIVKTSVSSTHTIYVIEEAKKCLLGNKSAQDLNVLKIGVDISNIVTNPKRFPSIPNFKAKFTVDENVPGVKIPFIRPPLALVETVENQLRELEEQEIIEDVKGPVNFLSQLLYVVKKDGSLRICVNMKNSNKSILRENYPLPTIEDFMSEFVGCEFYSTVDLERAYYHVELDEASRDLTAFMTKKGPKRFTRLIFGVNAAPEMFQKIMDEMCAGLQGVAVYLDDFLIGGKTKAEHDTRLAQLMERITKNNLTVNQKKSKFCVPEVEFLGFTFNKLGMRPSADKVQGLTNYSKPTSVEEIESFIGFITFMSHFIPNFSAKTEPLRKVIKSHAFYWNKEQEEAFCTLTNTFKDHIMTLGYYDLKDDTFLYTDASPIGLGAVLVQSKNGKNRIISCISKSLTETERNYPQPHREALGAVWAIEKWSFYLLGRPFKLYCDLQALEYLYRNLHRGTKRSITRAEGFLLRLMPYDFKIEYVKSKDNIADSLSRLIEVRNDSEFNEDSKIYLCAIEIDSIPLKEIIEEIEQDEELKALKASILTGHWSKTQANYHAMKHELAVVTGVITRNSKIILPKTLIGKALQMSHSSHCGASSMKRILKESFWWQSLNRDVDNYASQCLTCAQISRKNPQPMQRSKLPETVFEFLSADFLKIPGINGEILLVTDAYSRYIYGDILLITTMTKVAESLLNLFGLFGFCKFLKVDNGPPFNGSEFKEFCEKYDIEPKFSPPRNPQSNGAIEVQNKGLVRAMVAAHSRGENLKETLKKYIFDYNTRPNSITGVSPLNVMTNRNVRAKFPVTSRISTHDDATIRARDEIAKQKGKEYADNARKARECDIEIGDKVLIKNFAQGKLQPKYLAVHGQREM